jgi:hypothetical protein
LEARRPRSPGRILRERAPGPRWARARSSAPPAPRPSWGSRVLGALLLIGTVTLVSCQAVMTAFSPGLY